MCETNTPRPMMPFGEAVKTCLSKYATFTGRARRSEYWWLALAWFLLYFAGFGIDLATGLYSVLYGMGPCMAIVIFGLFLPNLAVQVRRLHDVGRSGWWVLIAIVPVVGFLALLYFYVQDSAPAPNRFGASPKYA